MAKTIKFLLPAGTLAVLAVFGSYYSKPLLAQARAALIRDADNPALQPVVLQLGTQAPFPQSFRVPPGKRLVIEYISWRGDINQNFVVGVGLAITTSGLPNTQWLGGSVVSGENIGGQKVFMVADPNTDVIYQSAGAIGSAPVTVSGYYVNLP